MRLRGVGGGASCAGGDGVGAVGEKLGGTRRNSKGMGGVRVFSGDVSDGSGGRRWELWGLEKKRVVVGFGGDGSGGVLFFGGDNNNFLPKRRTFGIIHIFGKV